MGSSSDEEEVFLIFLILERKLKKNKRRQCARSISQNKETTGHYHALIQEMHMSDRESFLKYVTLQNYKKHFWKANISFAIPWKHQKILFPDVFTRYKKDNWAELDL